MNRRDFLAASATLMAAPAVAETVCFPKNPPFYVPQSGTVGAGGAFTLDVAPDNFSDADAWSYFPKATAWSFGVEGWYWTHYDSPTTGTVYVPSYRGGANVAGTQVLNPYDTNYAMPSRTFVRPEVPAILNTTNVGINFVIEGDSISVGPGIGYEAYQMGILSAYQYGEISLFHHMAMGGSTMPMLAARSANVDGTIRTGRTNVLIAWAGTNDLRQSLATWDQILAELVDYCVQRRTAGFKVIVATMLPRSNQTPPNFEADRQSYNGKMRATWWQFADGLADVAADDRIGAPGAELNTTYYLDRTHPIDAGYAIIAPIFKAAVDRLLP